NFPGAYIVGNTLHYQDLEWYEALKDGKLKDEALLKKAIMEGTINDVDELLDETWDNYESTTNDNDEKICKDTTYDASVCKIRIFEIIKYSFRDDEKYVAIKEDEYDDLMSTNKNACRAYQEIFRSMDEGWVESSYPNDENLINENEVAKIFRIETNIFDFETLTCKAFKEFNYLLKIDPDVLNNDIVGFKTYEDYKEDWIYEWNKDVPWVHEKPWTDCGVWE
nr:hypothetical protein [Tanacetum cinerariifolium]